MFILEVSNPAPRSGDKNKRVDNALALNEFDCLEGRFDTFFLVTVDP